MTSRLILLCGIMALVLLILQTVSVATPSWLRGDLEYGLFVVCVPGEFCIPYGDIPSFHYLGFVGLSLLGCLTNFVAVMSCLVQAITTKPRPEHSFLRRLAVVWLISGGLILSAVIWINFKLLDSRKSLLNVLAIINKIPKSYSFCLGCIAGGGNVIAAIVFAVISRRMTIPAMTADLVFTETPQMLVIETDVSDHPSIDNTGRHHHLLTNNPANATYGLAQNHPFYGYDQT